MPSFSLTNPSPSSSSVGSTFGSIVAYARSLLPPSFNDFVPFILAGLMTLLFTALLVLLVEDSEDSYPHSPNRTDNGNSRSASAVDKGKRRSKRLVGLAERDSDAAYHGTEDDEESLWAWDPRADVQTTHGDLKMSTEWNRVQKEQMALTGDRYRTHPRLLASPPPSASPQSPAFTPPILSMAKLIMHRHVQSSKRARAASPRPSPPPSPPAFTTSGSGSFGPMQYTLKSAALKDVKTSVIVFPSSEESDSDPGMESPSPSSSPSSSPLSPVFPSQSAADLEGVALPQPTNASMPQPTSPTLEAAPKSTPQSTAPSSKPISTRHARPRSVAQPLLSSLVPAFQLLQPAPPTPPTQLSSASEHTPSRGSSSLLEEGGLPAHLAASAGPSSPQQTVAVPPLLSLSESQKTHRTRKNSGSGAKRGQHGHQRSREPSEGLVALEEGSR